MGQEKTSSKPNKSGIYPVCNGAECMCDQSKEKIPALLKVISHDAVYVNDKDGTSKILATTNDLPLPFEKQSNVFGSCLKQPLGFGQFKPCIPNILQWDKSYESINIAQANNGTALLKESEGKCSFGGKITFTTHGQTQTVSQADVTEAAPEVLAMLTDGILTEEEAEQLAKGTFKDDKTKSIEDINVDVPISLNPDNDTYKIHVNHKKLIFKVSNPSDLTAKEKAGVNWAVYIKNKNGTYSHYRSFIDHGARFTFPYRTPGVYAIEAYGKQKTFKTNTGSCKGSASNLLEIVYQDIAGLSLYGDGEDRSKIKQIRPTETIVVSVKKLFKDAYHVKSNHIYWEVTSAKESINFEKSTTPNSFGGHKTDYVPQITIPPLNNKVSKIVTVTATFGKRKESITFRVGQNYVKQITADKETITVLEEHSKSNPKPRHKVTFAVDKTTGFVMPYDAIKDVNVVVKWCIYNKKTKDAKQQLANAKKNKLEVSSEIIEQATKHTIIETKGKEHIINPANHSYIGTSDKEGEWYIEAFGINPTGDDKTSKPIRAIQPKITKAYWSDKKGNPISKSGYGHQVYIHIETEGMQGEKLKLNVWEKEVFKDTLIENAGTEIEIKEANGVIHQAFTIPEDDKAGILELYKYEFFFTIEKLDFKVIGTKQDPQANNQYILIPKKGENPHYLYVDAKKQIISLKIYEENDKLHTGIVKYGDTVTIKVKTRNFVNKELTFEVWQDVKVDNYTDAYSTYDVLDDKSMNKSFKIKINNEGYGEASFTIPKDWESKHKAVPQQPYYFYLKEKNTGEEFPRAYYVKNPNKTEEENKRNSRRIEALMLKVAKDDVRDGHHEYVNAVILGEELKSEEKEENKCPRCEEEITLNHIESLFGVLGKHKKFRQEIVNNLNKYIKQARDRGTPLHLNTCLRKAHFFAQVGAETFGINPNWMVETDVKAYTEGNITQSLFGTRAVKLKNSGNLKAYCAERPQKKLLNFLYAKENGFGNGNGNEASGDGYKFRGRGLKQLTGRGNYREATKFLKAIFPDEYVDLERNPNKVKEPKYAVLTAIAYWEKKSVWQTADQIKEITEKNVKRVRKKINGGTAGWKDVKRYLEKGFEVFKVEECVPIASENNISTNEFGLVQVTKLGNPYILNNDSREDSYSYIKKDGTKSSIAKHGDDWMLPEKAKAFSNAVYKLVKEFPKQRIIFNDASAYNPLKNLGHAATGAHSRGEAFDCKFLTVDGKGVNNIHSLTKDELKINGRFIELLKETGQFSTFYTHNGKIPGSVHAKGHADHLHGN